LASAANPHAGMTIRSLERFEKTGRLYTDGNRLWSHSIIGAGYIPMYSRQMDLLSLISNPNGTSRIELARATGKSPAKIGKLIQRLVNAGVLTQEEPIETSRGRRPILLRPSQGLGYLLGVDIGMIHLRVVLTDMRGTILRSIEQPSNARADLDTALKAILDAIDSLLADYGVPRDKLRAIGISHSGGIDPKSGVCLYWHLAMHWKGVPLKKLFSDYYGVPALVDDSVHCMALAEKTFGAALSTDTFILINVGQGIRSGLFIDGQLFRGAEGIAGELGHTTILPGGPRCSCGNRGCLESLASGKSIMDATMAALGDNVTTSLQEIASHDPAGITVDAISAAARGGDRLARRIISQAGSYLGIAVANLINLLNPPLIVFAGGTIAAAEELLMETIIREASASAFEVAFTKTKIVRSPLDNFAAARGAALLVTKPALKEFWNKVITPGSKSARATSPGLA